jgi:sugar lactone lactonase YvrE
MADAAPPIPRLISDAGAMIGESPAWRNGTVTWTDPVSRRLLRREQDGELRSMATASSVWSLAALPDGALAGALDDRFCIVGPTGDVSVGPTATIDPGCRFNDMAADRRGGLWVGMMHRGVLATRGAIFHARSPLETPVRVAQGLGVPNGMKLSADGRTLFVVDTLERTLLAYAVDGDTLAEPTIVSDFLGLPGKPDGMTLAQDGGFWVAMWGGGCIVHLARDGAFLRRIDVPAPHVSSLCFAGDDRLLVTTSRMRLSLQALRDHPGSGGLFEVMLEPFDR